MVMSLLVVLVAPPFMFIGGNIQNSLFPSDRCTAQDVYDGNASYNERMITPYRHS